MQHHILRGAKCNHLTARIATLWPQINQPIRCPDHIQIVLNDDQRMSRVHQLAQGAHQLGNIVKVQAGGGLVQHEQCALACQKLLAGTPTFGRLRQKACEFEALCFASRQRRHRLTQLHIFQPHVDDRLQHADHFAVVGK